jgi:hypothetical protein
MCCILLFLFVGDKIFYSLRLILLFSNIDVSRHILVIDIFILTKSNMGRREYISLFMYMPLIHYAVILFDASIKLICWDRDLMSLLLDNAMCESSYFKR